MLDEFYGMIWAKIVQKFAIFLHFHLLDNSAHRVQTKDKQQRLMMSHENVITLCAQALAAGGSGISIFPAVNQSLSVQ